MVNKTKSKQNAEFQEKLYKTLKKNGAMTRNELVKKIGKPRTTIYDNLDKLIQKKQVKKFPKQWNPKGRPNILFLAIV